jgi:hypothetical protein
MPKSTLTDPKAPNASPSPSASKASWLDVPYGPAAEERMEARDARIRAGEISLASILKLTPKPKA